MDIGKGKLEALLDMEERPATFNLIDKATEEPYAAADGSPVTITVVGADSKRVRDALDVATKQLLVGRRLKATPADLHTNRIATAAAAVVAWHGIEADGVEVPCVPENVKGLLSVPDHLRQVEEMVERHARFFVKPSTT